MCIRCGTAYGVDCPPGAQSLNMLRLLYMQYYLSQRNNDAASRRETPFQNRLRSAGITKVSLRATSTVFVPEMCRLLAVAATQELLSVIYRLADVSALLRDNQFEFSVTRLHATSAPYIQP